jgi:hypothetical protein
MKLLSAGVIVCAASCISLAQAPFLGRGLGFGGGLEAFTRKAVTGEPFSAQVNVQRLQTLANGNQIRTQGQSNIYRDSQGRVRIDTTITSPGSSGQTRTMTTIHDPVAGYEYRLNPQKMNGVQVAIHQRTEPSSTSSSRVRPANRFADLQVQTQSLGTTTINGVDATGTQVTRTIPAGTIGNSAAIQMVRATWVSTALGVPVQVTVSDPRSGTETMNLTNIVTAEPSGSLFVVPSGYTITSAPSRSGARFRRP